MGTTRTVGPARERILSTAYGLFSRHGVQAVGVDRIVAEAGVAKMTLYRHFRSKEELVLAALERREELWSREWLEKEVERRGRTSRERLLAIFDVLDEWFRRDDYEGCLFIKCLLEEGGRTSPIGAASATAVANVRSFVRGLASGAAVRDPDRLAHQWLILMRGSIVAAVEGDAGAALRARELGALVLAAEIETPSVSTSPELILDAPSAPT